MVTAKLICSFVLAQAFCWFSYAVAHIVFWNYLKYCTGSVLHEVRFLLLVVIQMMFPLLLYESFVNLYMQDRAVVQVFEPPHGKTNNLHRRKQRRRSASR